MAKAELSVLSTEEALELLRLSGKRHKIKGALPPEIVETQKKIEAAIRNAELFIARLRVVDWGMIDSITQMEIKLDALFGAWTKQEARDKRTLH